MRVQAERGCRQSEGAGRVRKRESERGGKARAALQNKEQRKFSIRFAR